MTDTFHTPVLLKEVLDILDPKPGKNYIDATIGGGGYTKEIVRRGGSVLGIDADLEATSHVRKEWTVDSGQFSEEKNYLLVQGNFRDIETIAKENGCEEVDGIVFDLGVSSHQIDEPGRGFSFRFADAPLDMRFDQTKGESARDLINRLTQEELYEIFSRFGEEQHSDAISQALIRARRLKPLETVGDVVDCINLTVAGSQRYAVYARIFQALRIAVNDELRALKQALEGSKRLLKSGGVLAVVSFHSLEDRIVKQFLKSHAFRDSAKQPVVASREEIQRNPRSRSAKLRFGIKL